MTQCPLKVVKIGGSLLELPDLAKRLYYWLDHQPGCHHVLLVGGGQLVEQVRSWHKLNPLDKTEAHWICIELMGVTAKIMHSRLQQFPVVEEMHQLRLRLGKRGATIFCPTRWLKDSEPHLPGTRVPISWEATSDSIAARLAVVLDASELVLLKSTLPMSKDLTLLAQNGYVDKMFPNFSSELPPIRCIDLKNTDNQEISLYPASVP